MNRLIETFGNCAKIIQPLKNNSILLKNIICDVVNKSGTSCIIYINFIKQTGDKISVFRLSVKEVNKFVQANLNIKTEINEIVEIQVLGQGDIFINLEYEYISRSSTENVKTITFNQKSKIKTVNNTHVHKV